LVGVVGLEFKFEIEDNLVEVSAEKGKMSSTN